MFDNWIYVENLQVAKICKYQTSMNIFLLMSLRISERPRLNVRASGKILLVNKFYGQATKGMRWMPWHLKAMKDVKSCDKQRWGALIHWPVDVRMGEPYILLPEYIRQKEPTEGSEPSQYLEEKKTTVIPLVAASERGTA